MPAEFINVVLLFAGALVVLGLIAFIGSRLRPPEEIAAPPEVMAPPDVVAPEVARVSLRDRLTQGLTKSRRVLAERISTIAGREKLDEEAWEEIEEALLRADIGVKVTSRIVGKLQESGAEPAQLIGLLRDELIEVLSRKDRDLQIAEGTTNVWLVTGVNGVGKTTSIAKLAHRLQSEGKSAVVAAADTFRAAAIDQLAVWAERAGVHMIKHQEGADPGAVVFDAIQYAKARDVDVVIADTAGRLHTKANLMEELKKIRRVADREAGAVSEVLLVLDATVGQNGISQARTFQEAIDITGVVLTKLDGTARGGIVVAIQEDLGIPVKAVGVGESIDDLQPFDPETFVDALLGEN